LNKTKLGGRNLIKIWDLNQSLAEQMQKLQSQCTSKIKKVVLPAIHQTTWFCL